MAKKQKKAKLRAVLTTNNPVHPLMVKKSYKKKIAQN